jgi:hypothetical protein
VSQPSINNISLLLIALENGAFHDDISKALKGMIEDLADHKLSHGGKPAGELNISLKFKLDENVMDIVPDFKVKVPKMSRGRSIYFVTPEHGLSRQDPRQMSFELDEARAQKYSGSRVPTTA